MSKPGGATASASWLPGDCVQLQVMTQAAPASISRFGRTGPLPLHTPCFPHRRLGHCWVREPHHRRVRLSVRCSHRLLRGHGLRRWHRSAWSLPARCTFSCDVM
eukprot:scaffold21302_cov50-Phaeocystis_antarctica.AAC.5